jgi:hypothetical protein
MQKENTEKMLSMRHLPIAQSLAGILKGVELDERDYKRHLGEKYL